MAPGPSVSVGKNPDVREGGNGNLRAIVQDGVADGLVRRRNLRGRSQDNSVTSQIFEKNCHNLISA